MKAEVKAPHRLAIENKGRWKSERQQTEKENHSSNCVVNCKVAHRISTSTGTQSETDRMKKLCTITQVTSLSAQLWDPIFFSYFHRLCSLPPLPANFAARRNTSATSTRKSQFQRSTSTSARPGLVLGSVATVGSFLGPPRLEEMVNMVPFRSNLARRTLKEAEVPSKDVML